MSEKEQQARRARLEALREAGVDPYPARVGTRTPIAVLRAPWEEASTELLEKEQPTAAIAGRIKAHRSFGKLLFMTLVDDGVAMQVSLRKQEVTPEVFAFAKKLDVGDFVRVEGIVWRTQKGELTLDARDVTMLAKCLRPLPEKWHGLADVETRYRQRYLDLLSNEQARATALLRSRVTTALREFLGERGFLEVETPILQPIYGGAAARPFTTHHNLLGQQLYLRVSDELYLKRLVIGGLDRVYEIGRNFRNEGISKKHNPEFTMLECYQAFADYHDMMDLTEEMVGFVADRVLGSSRVEYQGTMLELAPPWPRTTIRDAIREKTGIDILAARDLPALQDAVREQGKNPGEAPTWAVLVDDLFSAYVEPTLIQPIFITNHPVELSPLAKRSSEDPRLVERFEPFIAGMEIGNAFTELNDPDDQRERFEAMGRAREQGDEEAHPMDEAFLLALEHGMPPTGGLGIGVDRLVMILANAANLREVILFPHLRTESE